MQPKKIKWGELLAARLWQSLNKYMPRDTVSVRDREIQREKEEATERASKSARAQRFTESQDMTTQ